jgi:predicted nucleic acid-binding protein
MRYLLDSGILLRVVNRDDALHTVTRKAVYRLKADGHVTVTGTQNMAEFWNVCTRPATARGGLGLSVDETHRRLRLIERVAVVLPDLPDLYELWKSLVIGERVMGVQVHDARVVALMKSHGIARLLTLNAADFARYSPIAAVTPAEVVAAAGK